MGLSETTASTDGFRALQHLSQADIAGVARKIEAGAKAVIHSRASKPLRGRKTEKTKAKAKPIQ